MKKNKIGFTLVEILVVIAVLVIVSTIVLVGYNKFIKKGRLSNDESIVEQWNTLFEGKKVLGERITNVVDGKALIQLEDYSGEFLPEAADYHFYYNNEDSQIYLVDDSQGLLTICYPLDQLQQLDSQQVYRLDKSYCKIANENKALSIDVDVLEITENPIVINVEILAKKAPAKINVTNCTFEYDKDNKTITISQITSDVVITEANE